MAAAPRLLIVPLAIALIALAVGLLSPAPAQAQRDDAPAQAASLPDIEDEVMCPICGTALNLAESPQAERERAFIRRLINQGLTKEEIKDELVAEFGEDVLAVPKTSGFELSAWIVPGLGMTSAAILLGFAVVRWRRSGDRGGGPPPAAETSGDTSRLNKDLDRYEM